MDRAFDRPPPSSLDGRAATGHARRPISLEAWSAAWGVGRHCLGAAFGDQGCQTLLVGVLDGRTCGRERCLHHHCPDQRPRRNRLPRSTPETRDGEICRKPGRRDHGAQPEVRPVQKSTCPEEDRGAHRIDRERCEVPCRQRAEGRRVGTRQALGAGTEIDVHRVDAGRHREGLQPPDVAADEQRPTHHQPFRRRGRPEDLRLQSELERPGETGTLGGLLDLDQQPANGGQQSRIVDAVLARPGASAVREAAQNGQPVGLDLDSPLGRHRQQEAVAIAAVGHVESRAPQREAGDRHLGGAAHRRIGAAGMTGRRAAHTRIGAETRDRSRSAHWPSWSASRSTANCGARR